MTKSGPNNYSFHFLLDPFKHIWSNLHPENAHPRVKSFMKMLGILCWSGFMILETFLLELCADCRHNRLVIILMSRSNANKVGENSFTLGFIDDNVINKQLRET